MWETKSALTRSMSHLTERGKAKGKDHGSKATWCHLCQDNVLPLFLFCCGCRPCPVHVGLLACCFSCPSTRGALRFDLNGASHPKCVAFSVPTPPPKLSQPLADRQNLENQNIFLPLHQSVFDSFTVPVILSLLSNRF